MNITLDFDINDEILEREISMKHLLTRIVPHARRLTQKPLGCEVGRCNSRNELSTSSCLQGTLTMPERLQHIPDAEVNISHTLESCVYNFPCRIRDFLRWWNISSTRPASCPRTGSLMSTWRPCGLQGKRSQRRLMVLRIYNIDFLSIFVNRNSENHRALRPRLGGQLPALERRRELRDDQWVQGTAQPPQVGQT